MVNHNIQVVTDGLIQLSAGGALNGQVTVIPCPIQVGKKIWSSEEIEAIPIRSLARAKFLTTSCAQFLSAYRKLPGVEIISIHPFSQLYPLIHQARVARQVLYPRRDISIFEAKAVGVGLGLLVAAARDTAHDPADFSSEEILHLLHRLQEMIHTLVLTRDLGSYLGRGTSLAVRRVWAMLWAPALLIFDGRAGGFQLTAQGGSLSRRNEAWAEALSGVPKPCQVWIRHRGFQQEIEPIRQRLVSLLQPLNIHIESRDNAFSPLMSQNYVEITIYPTPEVIEELKRILRAG